MGKKTRDYDHDLDYDALDDYENGLDDDYDLRELSRDIYSTEWGDFPESDRTGLHS